MNGGLLKSAVSDAWYKALLYIGAALIMISLTIDVKWLSNETLGLVGFGLFFYSLGEWSSITIVTEMMGSSAIRYLQKKRNAVSIALQAAGIALLLITLASALLKL